MSEHNITEESYECYCMECGDIIKRKDGETEKEQEEWFIMDDELKLCSKCEQSTDEEEDERCFCCGTTCLDHTSNKGRGSEYPCETCGQRCKYCPCDCPDDDCEKCYAHEIGSSCECEYCSENPDCDTNGKGKTCTDHWEHSEMCAECVLLSGFPRYQYC